MSIFLCCWKLSQIGTQSRGGEAYDYKLLFTTQSNPRNKLHQMSRRGLHDKAIIMQHNPLLTLTGLCNLWIIILLKDSHWHFYESLKSPKGNTGKKVWVAGPLALSFHVLQVLCNEKVLILVCEEGCWQFFTFARLENVAPCRVDGSWEPLLLYFPNHRTEDLRDDGVKKIKWFLNWFDCISHFFTKLLCIKALLTLTVKSNFKDFFVFFA